MKRNTTLRSKIPAPTAHKLYDFQAISLRDLGLTPLLSRHNLQIALDGHPVSGKLQPIQQGCQCQVLRHLTRFAVEMDVDQPVPLTLVPGRNGNLQPAASAASSFLLDVLGDLSRGAEPDAIRGILKVLAEGFEGGGIGHLVTAFTDLMADEN